MRKSAANFGGRENKDSNSSVEIKGKDLMLNHGSKKSFDQMSKSITDAKLSFYSINSKRESTKRKDQPN